MREPQRTGRLRLALAALILQFIANGARGEVVHVAAGGDAFAQGYSFATTDGCYVATPWHVIGQQGRVATRVAVTDRRARQREAVVLPRPNAQVDLAFLRLDRPPDGPPCSAGRLVAGSLDERLARVFEGHLAHFDLAEGRQQRVEIIARSNDPDGGRVFGIKAVGTEPLVKGMSGSVVYDGDTALGLLLNVDDGEGQVLRMDIVRQLFLGLLMASTAPAGPPASRPSVEIVGARSNPDALTVLLSGGSTTLATDGRMIDIELRWADPRMFGGFVMESLVALGRQRIAIEVATLGSEGQWLRRRVCPPSLQPVTCAFLGSMTKGARIRMNMSESGAVRIDGFSVRPQ